MKYIEILELLEKEFKRYTGVKKETFELMVQIIKDFEKDEKKKIGGPTKLSVEDQVLATLMYWREYRTQEHIAVDFKVSQQTIGRAIIKIENILIKSNRLKRQKGEREEVIIIDAMESPIERPQKKAEKIL